MKVLANSQTCTSHVGEINIADARRVWSLCGVEHVVILPVVYFHEQDVKSEYLVKSEKTTTCPLKSIASYWL